MTFNTDYDCIYEAHGYAGNKEGEKALIVDDPLEHRSCFGPTYRKIKYSKFADITYRIYLFSENLPGKHFNLCTEVETRKILRCLQKTASFSYKFEKGTFWRDYKYRYNTGDPEVEYNVLVITIKGTYPQHMWITSMLRGFFEYPFNIAAKEACVLQSTIKEVDGVDFTKENWINLFLTIASQLGSTDLHGVATLDRHPKPRTYHEWRQKIGAIQDQSVCDHLNDLHLKSGYYVTVRNEEEFSRGVPSRAAKYTAAYKDKLSWKK